MIVLFQTKKVVALYPYEAIHPGDLNLETVRIILSALFCLAYCKYRCS